MIGLKYSMNYDIQNDRPKIFLEHRRDEDLLPTLLASERLVNTFKLNPN